LDWGSVMGSRKLIVDGKEIEADDGLTLLRFYWRTAE
jgi:hypothetical protein